jgi:siroheme synthase-like protein
MKGEQLYPIFLKLAGQRCLVVGGGAVAQRKIVGLKECGAEITVVSPKLTPELEASARRGEFRYLQRCFQEQDLVGVQLVICATDDPEVNGKIARMCRDRGIFVNVVDQPELSTFFVPAVVRRGPLSISISTGGTSPLLARRVRELLENVISDELGELAALLGELRSRVRQKIPDASQRQALWEKILTPELLKTYKPSDGSSLKEQVEACLSLRSE